MATRTPTTTPRKGFALPMAVLALALVTAAIVAAHTATSAEIVTNNAMRAQDHAYRIAEAGLQQFMLRRGDPGFCTACVIDPTVADSEWTRVSIPGGHATVVARRVRPRLADGSPSIFFIRSTGVDTTVKMSGAGNAVYATRTVGQYATFGTANVKALGAWTSLNGVTNNSVSNTAPIMGANECGGLGTAGAVVPRGGQYRGSGRSPTGSPNVDSTMTLDSLRKRVGIDWNAIVNFDAIPADITIPPSGNFPPVWRFNDTTYWPVIRIKGSYTIPHDGRGIIIADSNLVFSSSNIWNGIVLVGGQLVSTGSDTTAGVVVSGLNRLLPGAVNPADGAYLDNDYVGNTKRFVYNSCKASRAAERLRVYFAWTNTWLDNIAVW